MLINKILESPNNFKILIRSFSLFFIANAIFFYFNGFKKFVLLDFLWLSFILFTFSFIKDAKHTVRQINSSKGKKYFLDFLLFLTILTIAIMLFNFYSNSSDKGRVAWLHYYSNGFYFLIPALMPLILILSLHFERHLAITIIMTICVTVIDQTRMNMIYYMIIFLYFTKINISPSAIKKILITFIFFIIAISFYRLYPKSSFINMPLELINNLFHSFWGGYYLYNEHAQSILFGKTDEYIRIGLVRMIPGIDVVASTLLDKVFGTNYSHGHYESIFYENHIFRYVEALGLEMNSYYTGFVFFKIGGYINALIFLFLIFYGSCRGSEFGRKVCKIWILLFLLSFDKYFINQNPGFSIIFLIALFYGVVALYNNIFQFFESPNKLA